MLWGESGRSQGGERAAKRRLNAGPDVKRRLITGKTKHLHGQRRQHCIDNIDGNVTARGSSTTQDPRRRLIGQELGHSGRVQDFLAKELP